MLACESDMFDPVVGFNDNYGHANKGCSVGSRLYLNADTYVGVNKYTECVTYSKKIISAGYQLEPVYGDMFKADNDQSKRDDFPIEI